MNNKDKDLYIQRYNKRLNEFGYNASSLGWGGGKERQFLRFKVLTEIGVEKNDSVLDVGCGFADLFEYLLLNEWQGLYTGIDINPKLLEVAELTHKNVNVKLIDILKTNEELNADWVICSGIFNAKLQYEDNLNHIKKMIKKMFSIANKGVAVDFLSTFVDFQHTDGYHTSPFDIITFIKKELNARFVLRYDYLPFEYLIYLKKNYEN